MGNNFVMLFGAIGSDRMPKFWQHSTLGQPTGPKCGSGSRLEASGADFRTLGRRKIGTLATFERRPRAPRRPRVLTCVRGGGPLGCASAVGATVSAHTPTEQPARIPKTENKFGRNGGNRCKEETKVDAGDTSTPAPPDDANHNSLHAASEWRQNH